MSINDGLNSVVCAIAVILAAFDSMLPNNHIVYYTLKGFLFVVILGLENNINNVYGFNTY